MARPNQPKLKSIHLRIDDEEWTALGRAARRERMPVSTWVRWVATRVAFGDVDLRERSGAARMRAR